MYSFVVLGQIPGTSITISFTMWALLAAFLLATTIWYKQAYKQKTGAGASTNHSNMMIIRNGKPVSAHEISL